MVLGSWGSMTRPALAQVHEGVTPTPPGRPATHVHSVELIDIPGHSLWRIAHQVPSVDNVVDLDTPPDPDGIGLGRQLESGESARPES